jgi:hypothetical protein
MFLHAESLPVRQEIPGGAVLGGAFDGVSARLRGLFEVALPAVLFKCVFSHVRDPLDGLPSP